MMQELEVGVGTDILRRVLSPISETAWNEIDLQALRILKGNLSGRKLVDFNGPNGWKFAAVNLGKLDMQSKEPIEGVEWGMHQVQPLVEFRVPFSLQISDLDDLSRGSKTLELASLKEAARKVAQIEERAIYWGFEGAGIKGMVGASSQAPVALAPDPNRLPESVEKAMIRIQESGIGGPFALVLGTEPYKWIMASDPHDYPLRERIDSLVEAGIHWSPALEDGVLFTHRGGDFEMSVGQDLAIGYKKHDTEDVELYFTESFTFLVLEPAGSVELKLQPVC